MVTPVLWSPAWAARSPVRALPPRSWTPRVSLPQDTWRLPARPCWVRLQAGYWEPTLTAKALIIHSMDDEQCPVANSQAMAELWPGSELVLLDGLGHRLIAQDPDVVA